MSRIGIFGGTFNPIHLGHLRAAEELVERLGLDHIRFVPNASPPHKPAGEPGGLAPAELRLTWTRLATDRNPRFEVDAIEVERAGPSFTADTLRILADRLRPSEPVFVIGEDAFVELDSWKDPESILASAHLAVIPRPPGHEERLAELLPDVARRLFELSPDGRLARHRQGDTWIRVVPTIPLAISSSDIRRRLQAGRSVRYLLPENVREAVEASGVYAAPAPESRPPAPREPRVGSPAPAKEDR